MKKTFGHFILSFTLLCSGCIPENKRTVINFGNIPDSMKKKAESPLPKNCYQVRNINNGDIVGLWIPIGICDGKASEIECFKIYPIDPSETSTALMTLNKNGDCIDNHSDYISHCKYKLNYLQRALVEYDADGEKGESGILEISRLDSTYLILTRNDQTNSYLYKRKE
ncbi:MAG: hypothetical protein ABIQ40_06200 [Bacteroidia bacterium]